MSLPNTQVAKQYQDNVLRKRASLRMMTLICILFPVLLVGLLLAAVIATIVQQRRKMKELCEGGIEATATGERNEVHKGTKIGGFLIMQHQPLERPRVIEYRYTDHTVNSHRLPQRVYIHRPF